MFCCIQQTYRFAQFFICPLFTESATDREVNAVNSEHERNLDDDTWRISQIEKATSDPNHDYSKFGTGNKETLKNIPLAQNIDTRKALLDFHEKWYSANIMCLSVVGKESIQELTDYVVPKFINVRNKDAQLPSWPNHPYRDEELRKEINVVPIKDSRSLSIRFPIPDLHQFYRAQPEHYIAHLIGHEGPGSLLSELKARGWVNVLNAYGSRGGNGFGFFNVNVDLTLEGMLKTNEIVELLFQYLNMVKTAGPQKWIFEESAQLEATRFRFKDKESPMGYVRNLSSLMHDYPMQEVICGSYVLDDWKPDLITDVCSRLIPDKVKVCTVGKSFAGKTNLKEKWYGTEYRIQPVQEDILTSWKNVGLHKSLHLPAQNEFITSNFELAPREAQLEIPEIIKNTDISRVWFIQDTQYLLPKAFYGFEITT